MLMRTLRSGAVIADSLWFQTRRDHLGIFNWVYVDMDFTLTHPAYPDEQHPGCLFPLNAVRVT
jgi:hypothetical protein